MNLIVNDAHVNAERGGKGPLVLMLHGWGGSVHTFDELASDLQKHYEVLRLDLPGFGKSEQPPEAWSIGDYADFLRDFLQKIDVDKVYAVVAHSFGGRITIKAVGEGSLDPQKIVLIGSAGIRPTPTLRNRVTRVVAKVGKLLTSLPGLQSLRGPLRKKLYGAIGNSDYYLAGGSMRQTFLKTIREDLRETAANIKQPTLLLWGELDSETPLSDGQVLNEQIPDSRLVVIDGASHFVHKEEPKQVARHVTEFLK